MFCKKCGRVIDDDSEFCRYCGTRMAPAEFLNAPDGNRANRREGTSNAEVFPMALPDGSVLAGQYIIEKPVGQGGFGITYIAKDHHSGETVALKEYFPETLATRGERATVRPLSFSREDNFEYGRELFLQEAKTLSKFIGNENIVRVYSYFEENNTAYFVMEYIDGISLSDYIKKNGGKITFEDAGHFLFPVMNALSVVHKKGIIHRDISPENILITKQGQAKLIDFGAARYSLGDKSMSLDIILKCGFAPKEQYSGHSRQGPFTDVYAMAATFYYAITGNKPQDSVDRLEEDLLVKPSAMGVKISPSVEKVLLHALEVLPNKRYQSMAEFKRAMLKALESFQPTENIEQSAGEPVFKAPASKSDAPIPKVEKKDDRISLSEKPSDKKVSASAPVSHDNHADKTLPLTQENAPSEPGSHNKHTDKLLPLTPRPSNETEKLISSHDADVSSSFTQPPSKDVGKKNSREPQNADRTESRFNLSSFLTEFCCIVVVITIIILISRSLFPDKEETIVSDEKDIIASTAGNVYTNASYTFRSNSDGTYSIYDSDNYRLINIYTINGYHLGSSSDASAAALSFQNDTSDLGYKVQVLSYFPSKPSNSYNHKKIGKYDVYTEQKSHRMVNLGVSVIGRDGITYPVYAYFTSLEDNDFKILWGYPRIIFCFDAACEDQVVLDLTTIFPEYKEDWDYDLLKEYFIKVFYHE